MRSQLQTIHIMTQVTFSRPLHRSWMNLIFCTRLIIFGAAVDGASVIQIVSSFEDANRFFKKKRTLNWCSCLYSPCVVLPVLPSSWMLFSQSFHFLIWTCTVLADWFSWSVKLHVNVPNSLIQRDQAVGCTWNQHAWNGRTCRSPRSTVTALRTTCEMARTKMKMCICSKAWGESNGTFPCNKKKGSRLKSLNYFLFHIIKL